MRVASIRIKNFKRFTDLHICDIPQTTKLVVVVGPNGCGKSSLFDAFLLWYRGHAGFGADVDEKYHKKHHSDSFVWNSNITVNLHGQSSPQKGSLYIRTAYRNDPDFTIKGVNQPNRPSEQPSINRVIENDQTVSQNYQRLVYNTLSGVYDIDNDKKTVLELREELIGHIQSSMFNVFGDLKLNSITDPLGDGTFYFGKGSVEAYHYKNLSGGEKAAFDLLLDVLVKRQYFQDAIYCVDEIEAHLHTRVQGALLKEMVNIIPDKSQMWTTTHSLGVIRAAHQMAAIDPMSVCIIDFDGVEPDEPHELRPSSIGRLSWEKLLSITLDDLSDRIAPKYIVVCEGSTLGNSRKNFDAEIYNRVLGSHFPDIVFLSGGASSQLENAKISITNLLDTLLPVTKTFALCDRDDLSEVEVQAKESAATFVLKRRNLESYLLDDEVLHAFVVKIDKIGQFQEVLDIRKAAVDASISRGNPPDDWKSAVGEFYVNIKQALGLTGCGNDKNTFMRDTLAPLITKQMQCFLELKEAIIDRILSSSN